MEFHRRLSCVLFSCWANIDRIENIEHLEHLEVSLRKSIERVHIHKENFRKSQLMSLECTATQVYSSFFESGNQSDQNCNPEQQFHCLKQQGNMLNELNGNSFHQVPSMYPVSKSFHFPDQPVFAATDHHQTWVSDFGCCNQVFDLSDNNQQPG